MEIMSPDPRGKNYKDAFPLERLALSRQSVSTLKKMKREAAAQRRPAQSERKNRVFPRNDRLYGLKCNAFQTEIALAEGFPFPPEEQTVSRGREMSLSTIVKRLQDIFRLLELYGAEDHITFDLSMSGNYGYYTGVIFRAYTYGTGDAIVRGGRYDHLLEKFGKSTPSIGFAIIVDELMSALSRQKIPTDTVHRNLIVYTEAAEDEAITLARAFRAKGRNIELMKNVPGTDRVVYETHARRSGTTVLLFLNDDMKIEMINLETGEKRSTDLIIPD